MTQQEWLTSRDPISMLHDMPVTQFTYRGLRLLGCAIVRSRWESLAVYQPQNSRAAVQFAERMAEDEPGSTKIDYPTQTLLPWRVNQIMGTEGVWAAARTLTATPVDRETIHWLIMRGARGVASIDLTHCCNLIRDTCCPFAERRAWAWEEPHRPSWLTPQVMKLARAAYSERPAEDGLLEIPRFWVLADCLEESGCDEVDLLAHLRGPGPHVRGCAWLDLLLGK